MGSVVRKLTKPFKKVAKKLVPKEAAGIMQMAAPFMGQYAGPLMYGLGSLKQRGRINPLGMALTMAPHLRFQGGFQPGLGRWKPTGYGGVTDVGRRSLRDMLLRGYTKAVEGYPDLTNLSHDEIADIISPEDWNRWYESDFSNLKEFAEAGELAGTTSLSMDPALGKYGTKLDELLYGTEAVPKGPEVGTGRVPPIMPEAATKGWLGTGGEYALGDSKAFDVLLGGKTKKMHHGHRGANHPVLEVETGKVVITVQNHGFEVLKSSLPKNVKISYKSLFDGSIEGLELLNNPVFSVQYHPEASPGPHDHLGLFKKFYNLVKENA